MRIANSLGGRALKYSAALFLVTLPLQASALDFTPNSARLLSDPAYLPQQGQVFGSTGYTHARTTGEVDNYLGAPNRSFTVTSNSLAQDLAYGITDDLTVRIDETYARNGTQNDFTSGTSTTTNANGFGDPAFGLTWRMLDQKVHPVSWDLIGTYSPNLMDAKSASPTQDGTIARGGEAATLGTAISYETTDFTVYAHGDVTFLGQRDILNANNTTTTYQSRREYSFGLNTQTRLNRILAVDAGMTETLQNSANGTNDTSLITFINKPGDVTIFSAALVYQIMPNRLTATLAYNHDEYSNSSTQYPVLPASDTTTRNESANVIGARLQYLFR